MSKENENVNYNVRFKPDYRYRDIKLTSIELKNFSSTEKSITDKEAYRVNLSTLRGQLANGSGSPTVGQYSIPAGKEYDKRYDFSYINRPDITIVELDSYIENMKKNLKEYDDSIKLQIQDEIKAAETKVEEMKKAELQKAEIKTGGKE